MVVDSGEGITKCTKKDKGGICAEIHPTTDYTNYTNEVRRSQLNQKIKRERI